MTDTGLAALCDDDFGIIDIDPSGLRKRTPNGWREARWHGTVITSDIPEALASRAAR